MGEKPTACVNCDDTSDKEFEYVWESLHNELNRFWVRFNILISIQFGLAYMISRIFLEGQTKKLEVSYIDVTLGSSVSIVLLLSIVCCLICQRAIDVYISMQNSLVRIGNGMEGKFEEIKALLQSLSVPATMYYGRYLALMLLYSWILTMFYVSKNLWTTGST